MLKKIEKILETNLRIRNAIKYARRNVKKQLEKMSRDVITYNTEDCENRVLMIK